MPVPTNDANEVAGAIRPEQLSPAQLGDYLPGAGLVPDPYAANANPAQVDALLTSAGEQLDALKAAAFAKVDQILADAKGVLAQLQAVPEGKVDALLAKSEKSATKLIGKAFQQVDLHLGNAIANAQALGLAPPEPVDVAAALQTQAVQPFDQVATLPDTVVSGAGSDTGPGGPGPCPTFFNNSDWSYWVITNRLGTYAEMTACLPKNAAGFPIAPEGQIVVNEAGLCPVGYVPNELGCHTPLKCCVLSTSGTDGTLDLGNTGCTVGKNWDDIPLSYSATTGQTVSSIDTHQVFQLFNTGEPAGPYDWLQLTYQTEVGGSYATVQFYAPTGAKVFVLGHSIRFAVTVPPGADVLPCLEIIRTDYSTGGITQNTITADNCPTGAGLPCAPGQPMNAPHLPDLGDGECVDWNLLQEALLHWEFDKSGVFGLELPNLGSGSVAAGVAQAATGHTEPVVPGLAARFKKWVTSFITELTTNGGCNVPGLVQTQIFAGVLEFLQKWTGAVPPSALATLEQGRNFYCPYNLPEQASADGTWLSGLIDDTTWECWTKSAGNLPTPYKAVRDAGRTRPNAAELCMLYRRGNLTDDQFSKRLREVGVTRDEEGQNIYDLTTFLPSPIDIVRFMVRDVGDPAMVAKFGLDAKFDDKIKGNIVTYAKAAGVDEEVLQDFWRAHWVIPSYTQLVDMMFRLRPGRVDAAIEVTEDDVRQALNHNDVLPFWVDRLMQLARPVLNRTDLLLAFTERTITDQEFTDGLQDLGYTQENAKRFLATYSRQRKLRDSRAAGLPTAKRLVKLFADGLITEQELHDVAFEITVSRKQRNQLIAQADVAREWAQRTCSVNAVKRQYVAGLVGEADAGVQLAKAGIEANEIPELIKCWGPAKQARGKVPGASQLCKWRAQGLLSAGQQTAALQRMGWAAPDAARITQSCSLDNAAKAQKSADAAARRAAADARKAPSKIKAAESAEQAELNREAKADIGYATHTRTTKKTTKPPEPADAPDGEVTTVVDQKIQDLP